MHLPQSAIYFNTLECRKLISTFDDTQHIYTNQYLSNQTSLFSISNIYVSLFGKCTLIKNLQFFVLSNQITLWYFNISKSFHQVQKGYGKYLWSIAVLKVQQLRFIILLHGKEKCWQSLAHVNSIIGTRSKAVTLNVEYNCYY